jgi:RimJ/RimL family protein N-acetyltransferase
MITGRDATPGDDPGGSAAGIRGGGPAPREVPAAGRWPRTGLVRGPVAVRVWEPDDVPALLELMRDPQSRRWSPIVTEPSEQDCRERVQRAREAAQAGHPSSFAVVDAEQPALVLGTFDWRNTFPPVFSIVDVGYAVAPAARGRGVAGTALALVTDWLLDPDGGDVERVQLDHAVENVASCRTALRAGFAVEGRRARFLPLRERPDAPVVRHEVCLHGRVRED